jgi:hypothetical protein
MANKDASNSIAVHHMATRHEMDWKGATCLEYASNYNQRMFLESWHTKSEKDSINVCRELPDAYYNERARAECERTRSIEIIN